jgi:hypothetical protein
VFALVYLLCAGEDLPPSSDADEATSGKSRPLRARFCTGTACLEWSMKGILFLGLENVLNDERNRFCKHCSIL